MHLLSPLNMGRNEFIWSFPHWGRAGGGGAWWRQRIQKSPRIFLFCLGLRLVKVTRDTNRTVLIITLLTSYACLKCLSLNPVCSLHPRSLLKQSLSPKLSWMLFRSPHSRPARSSRRRSWVPAFLFGNICYTHGGLQLAGNFPGAWKGKSQRLRRNGRVFQQHFI